MLQAEILARRHQVFPAGWTNVPPTDSKLAITTTVVPENPDRL
jgi:hypothetical protein